MIEIDGRILEGGGQVLRTAICLSALNGKPLKVTNIRGNRSGGGGLKRQHLTGLVWLANACGAETRGAEVKSKEIEFIPGVHMKNLIVSPKHRNHLIDIGSLGAVTLVFQAILPFLFFSPFPHPEYSTMSTQPRSPSGLQTVEPSSKAPKSHIDPLTVTIQGGTNVSNSPSIDYVQQVLLPMLGKCGLPSVKAELSQRGWSSGGHQMGSVTFTVTPMDYGHQLPSLELLARSELTSLRAMILAPRHVEKDFCKEVKQQLKSSFPDTKDVEVEFEASGSDSQIYLLMVATTENGYRLGSDELYGSEEYRSARRSSKVSNMGAMIAKMVSRVVKTLVSEVEHGGCVDTYMRDQLVVFAALARGNSKVYGGEVSKVDMSLHTKTVWWVVQQMLGVQRQEQVSIDTCTGSGFVGGAFGIDDVEADAAATEPADTALVDPEGVVEKVRRLPI